MLRWCYRSRYNFGEVQAALISKACFTACLQPCLNDNGSLLFFVKLYVHIFLYNQQLCRVSEHPFWLCDFKDSCTGAQLTGGTMLHHSTIHFWMAVASIRRGTAVLHHFKWLPKRRAAPSIQHLSRLKRSRCNAKYILKSALLGKLLYSRGLLALLISLPGIIHFWLRVFRANPNSCLWLAVRPRDFW